MSSSEAVAGGGVPMDVKIGVGTSHSNSNSRKEKQQPPPQVGRSASFQFQQQQQQQIEAVPLRVFTCNNNNCNSNDKLLLLSSMACNNRSSSSSSSGSCCSTSSTSGSSQQHHRYFPDLMIPTNPSTVHPTLPPPPPPSRVATTSAGISCCSRPSGALPFATAATIVSHHRAPPHHKFSEGEDDNDDDDDDDELDDVDDDDVSDDEGNHCDDHHSNEQKSILSDSNVGPSGQLIILNDEDPPPAVASTGKASTVPCNNNDPVVGCVGMGTVAKTDRDACFPQYLRHTTEGSCCDGADGIGARGSHLVAPDGFSGTKNKNKEKQAPSLSAGSGDSLRSILSDPVTGALMDDAFILPCGHSFGRGGIQHVIKMKACYTCSWSISEDSISPNLSLQTAVQAFRREEEMRHCFKRRREGSEQLCTACGMTLSIDKGINTDSNVTDTPWSRGVQFPFAVTDRVIIKGNKRTPQRFIGREAIVTTQCLNGWYVVKTLDNAESVKLQYRSLAKLPQESSSKTISNKMAPIWH